jgi:hypothetical protein
MVGVGCWIEILIAFHTFEIILHIDTRPGWIVECLSKAIEVPLGTRNNVDQRVVELKGIQRGGQSKELC